MSIASTVSDVFAFFYISKDSVPAFFNEGSSNIEIMNSAGQIISGTATFFIDSGTLTGLGNIAG